MRYPSSGLNSINHAVMAPDGTVVPGANASFGGGSFFQEPVTLPQTGTYTIKVDPGTHSTGTVTVTTYAVPADVVQSTSTPTTAGVSGQVTVSAPGQGAAIEFDGRAGEAISGTVSQGILNGRLRLEKPDGTRIGAETFVNNLERFRDAVALPGAGRYRLVFDPYEEQIGTVTLTAFDATELTRSSSIGGAAVPLTIAAPGQNARIAFSGSAGQLITVDFSGTTLPSVCSGIIAPGGALSDYGCNSGSSSFSRDFTVPAAGTSAIFVDPWGMDKGSVTVAIRARSAARARTAATRGVAPRRSRRVPSASCARRSALGRGRPSPPRSSPDRRARAGSSANGRHAPSRPQ